jgi:hypothetical protein
MRPHYNVDARQRPRTARRAVGLGCSRTSIRWSTASPRAVEGGELDQWLALRVAREALFRRRLRRCQRLPRAAALILGKGTYANRGTLSVVQHALIVDYTLGLLKSIQPALSEGSDDSRRSEAALPRFDTDCSGFIPNARRGVSQTAPTSWGPASRGCGVQPRRLAIDIAVGLRQASKAEAAAGPGRHAGPGVEPVQLKALSERIRPFDKDADGRC